MSSLKSPVPAIVLTSGGLDSTTCLAIARRGGFAPLYSLAFDYGQRHRHELEAAATGRAGVRRGRAPGDPIDLRQFGKSALTDDIAVPKDRRRVGRWRPTSPSPTSRRGTRSS